MLRTRGYAVEVNPVTIDSTQESRQQSGQWNYSSAQRRDSGAERLGSTRQTYGRENERASEQERDREREREEVRESERERAREREIQRAHEKE